VAADADSFSFGGYLNMHGRAWFDDLSLSVVGRNGEGNQGPHPLDDLAVENLVAFARLLGYVRHFHPSDEAATTDWDAFAIAGVIQVESARSPSDLKARLGRLFRVVAPTVRLSTKPLPPLEIGVLRGGSDVAGIIGWHHRGWAGRFPGFFVQRRIMARENAPGDSVLPIGSEMNTHLGGGVWCSVPLTLYTGHRGTVPRGSGAVRLPERPEGWIPTGNDRATRLAGVVLSWNVIQHFHPYLGVIDADWPAQLPLALREAAVDTDGAAYEETLRRLAATAQDGHVHVTSPYAVKTPRRWPFAWSFVEDRLVLTQADTTLLKDAQVGDQVITIQGRPVEEWISEATPLESGATPEHVRVRVARDLPTLVGTDTLTLDLRSPTGQARRSVAREHDNPSLRPSLPDSVEEVRPGVWYLDLNRITDADLESTLPRINTGKAVIFDLRGYPRHAFRSVIAHLSETAVQYPRQGFPVILRPDHSDTTFAWGTWSIEPAQPRIQTRAAFLIDANAISAAETLLSIVEHYRLAELVGERTAGTNGVITEVRLPGRYSVSFTGMRVLKHNGSRHHGVGILPTVPVSRTIVGVAAGRDEQLERAIEVVSR
jgi:C-terminal processing protease CtpA/Prc